MKWLAAALGLTVLLLQYRLWVAPEGVRELKRLEQALAAQRAENTQLAQRNRQLAAEVRDLKTGMTALEERARNDLGMIGSDETFYQVVPPAAEAAPASTATTRTAAR